MGGRPRPPGLRQQNQLHPRLDPSVSCNGNTFPLCRSPKLLGVTFDTHFTFSPHIRGVAESARSRLGILKALAGVSWGQSKEVLLFTYQMLIKPILSYAAPLIDGITQPDSYRESLRRVHSDAVAAAIAALSPNRLLGVSPPAVSASERRLPRAHRTTLSQLRSGFSSTMRDYRHRIGAELTPECPECADPCHSVPHLFRCPARPTDLSVGDMWERPLEVARFLLSVPSFSRLPELPSPPTEPHPSTCPRQRH